MRKNIGFKISLILVIILLATALLAPVLAPNDPNVTNIMLSEAKPSADYPLGRCVYYGNFYRSYGRLFRRSG